MIKIENYIEHPIFDHLVKKNLYYIQITVENYLKMVNLDDNPLQRNVLDYDLYKKLIRDILYGASFPPISVVTNTDVLLEKGFNDDTRLSILDGLQRTNCLFVCKSVLDGEVNLVNTDREKYLYKNTEEFLKKIITIELWEKLDLRSILYKMIVLNTGQRKMDNRHQLDILIGSLKEFLQKNEINFIEIKEKNDGEIPFKDLEITNTFPLYTIAEGIVAYINKYPQFTQNSATEFLFEKLDIQPDSYEEGIRIIEDEDTYIDLAWVLKDLSLVLVKKYNYNIFIKYPLFLSSFFAAMGFTKAEFDKNQLNSKKKLLIELINQEDISDPLNIDAYNNYYNQFKSGIGTKRRKLVYTAFKNYFSSPIINKIDWKQAYQEVK